MILHYFLEKLYDFTVWSRKKLCFRLKIHTKGRKYGNCTYCGKRMYTIEKPLNRFMFNGLSLKEQTDYIVRHRDKFEDYQE